MKEPTKAVFAYQKAMEIDSKSEVGVYRCSSAIDTHDPGMKTLTWKFRGGFGFVCCMPVICSWGGVCIYKEALDALTGNQGFQGPENVTTNHGW